MHIDQYVEGLCSQVESAAALSGPDAVALTSAIMAPLGSAIRLTILEALSAAAEEITRELAPDTLDLRLRAGQPEFVLDRAYPDESPPTPPTPPMPPTPADDPANARVNLRLPEQLKSRAERAAARDGLSLNTWLVRAISAALNPPTPTNWNPRAGEHFTGWVH